MNATGMSFYLSNNHIINIDVHAFGGIEHVVTYLDLENNNLTHIPLVLSQLSSLHSLYLSGNPLVSLDASVLANLSSNLWSFSVSVDGFPIFPNELLLLTRLSGFTMDNISLSLINTTVCHKCEKNLKYLEMSYAKFDRIPVGVCRLTSLRTFTSNFSPTLSRNASSMFDACNDSMPSVTSLILQHNQLTTLPRLGPMFPSLESLDLSGNALHYIESSSLAGLTSLNDLDISDNHFTRIPFAVNKAFNLNKLKIDNNQIDTVEDLDLSSLQNLTRLYMDGNPLVYLSPNAFTYNPLLNLVYISATNLGHLPQALLRLNYPSDVYLSGRGIECSCKSMAYMKSWNVTSVNVHAICRSGKSVQTYLITDLPHCH